MAKKAFRTYLAERTASTTGVSMVPGLNTAEDTVVSLDNFAAAAWLAEYERSIVHEIRVDRYLTDPDDAAANVVGLQEMINDLYASWVSDGRGGVLRFPPFIKYLIEGSHEAGTIYNGSSAVLESTAGLIMKAGVSLIGPGRYSGGGLRMTDPALTMIYLLEPDMCVVQGMELGNDWTVGEAGAGHGLLTMKRATGSDTGAITTRVVYDDLYVHNVGSYGLSMQNGRPNGCTISNCEVYYTGADGIDLKGRYETDTVTKMNNIYNIRVRNHGVRVDGSAGVDIRGEWNADMINVAEFGALNNALTYIGFRFRTKATLVSDEDQDGSRSSLSNFSINCTGADPAAVVDGLSIGSDDISISNGVVQGGRYGVIVAGNGVGAPLRTTISSVHTKDATAYGFYLASGIARTTLLGTSSEGSTTAGIRNEGTYTTIIGHQSDGVETAKSSSATALLTEQVVGNLNENLLSGSLTISDADDATVQLLSQKNGTWTVGERVGALEFYSADASGIGAGVRAAVRAEATITNGGATTLAFYASQTARDTKVMEMTDALVWALVAAIPTYADDAAAGAGGLTQGRWYKTSAGSLQIKL